MVARRGEVQGVRPPHRSAALRRRQLPGVRWRARGAAHRDPPRAAPAADERRGAERPPARHRRVAAPGTITPRGASSRGMKRLSSVITVIAAGCALAVFAAPAGASTVGLAKVGKLGNVLVNGKGVTVYLFEKDKHGKSSCYGACAKAWSPVLTTGKPKAKDGARSSLLGTTKRTDGKLQITYHG